MAYQSVFQRKEYKYILTRRQAAMMKELISGKMRIDQYGPTTIRNIYFDTDDYKVIRESLEKPVYKEKLRVRSYSYAKAEDTVFVELKKKYNGLGYKRRIQAGNAISMKWLCEGGESPEDSQIAREITYFRDRLPGLSPKVFLTYEREAYEMTDGSAFRVTFDTNILGRETDMCFSSGIYGTPILSPELVIMELKIEDAIPLWMARCLDDHFIVRSSFSKYGEYYKNFICSGKNEDQALPA